MYREYTDKMDISGMGGSYEKACQTMVIAGLEYLDDKPDFIFLHIPEGEIDRVETPEVEDVRNFMLLTCEGCTGAMMGAAIQHVYQAFTHGWDWYVEQLENRKDEEA